MKRTAIILALSLLMFSTGANAQVKFFSNFECGRLGNAELADSSNIYRPNLEYNITSAKDPDNPVKSVLRAGCDVFRRQIEIGGTESDIFFNGLVK